MVGGGLGLGKSLLLSPSDALGVGDGVGDGVGTNVSPGQEWSVDWGVLSSMVDYMPRSLVAIYRTRVNVRSSPIVTASLKKKWLFPKVPRLFEIRRLCETDCTKEEDIIGKMERPAK